jgi:hypothetical protein
MQPAYMPQGNSAKLVFILVKLCQEYPVLLFTPTSIPTLKSHLRASGACGVSVLITHP